jgi:hypothetical protein
MSHINVAALLDDYYARLHTQRRNTPGLDYGLLCRYAGRDVTRAERNKVRRWMATRADVAALVRFLRTDAMKGNVTSSSSRG